MEFIMRVILVAMVSFGAVTLMYWGLKYMMLQMYLKLERRLLKAIMRLINGK